MNNKKQTGQCLNRITKCLPGRCWCLLMHSSQRSCSYVSVRTEKQFHSESSIHQGVGKVKDLSQLAKSKIWRFLQKCRYLKCMWTAMQQYKRKVVKHKMLGKNQSEHFVFIIPRRVLLFWALCKEKLVTVTSSQKINCFSADKINKHHIARDTSPRIDYYIFI